MGTISCVKYNDKRFITVSDSKMDLKCKIWNLDKDYQITLVKEKSIEKPISSIVKIDEKAIALGTIEGQIIILNLEKMEVIKKLINKESNKPL